MSGTRGEISGRKGPRRYDAPAEFHLRDDLDFYIEPEWVVEALLDAEKFAGMVHDPACGSGTIVRVCQRRNIFATGSDIVDRDGSGFERNFLADENPHIHNIICNPPYRDAQKFVEKALQVASGKIAMLVQAKFLFSQKRWVLFDRDPPARIYFLSQRPSMPPGEQYLRGEIEAKGGKVDYCWLVWNSYHHHPADHTRCRWLLRPVAK